MLFNPIHSSSRQNSLFSFIHPLDHIEYLFSIFKEDKAEFHFKYTRR